MSERVCSSISSAAEAAGGRGLMLHWRQHGLGVSCMGVVTRSTAASARLEVLFLLCVALPTLGGTVTYLSPSTVVCTDLLTDSQVPIGWG